MTAKPVKCTTAVPAGSVVVSGNLPSKDGSYSLYCAVIVKKVDAKTLAKPASTNCCVPSIKFFFPRILYPRACIQAVILHSCRYYLFRAAN